VGQKKLVRKAAPPSKRGIRWPRWTGFRGMTVRDWLDLLVVPLALVVISFLFTTQQDQRQQKIENQRAEAERELAVERAQDEALQAYLDQMSGLLLERDLRTSEKGSEVRTLARARTLTVLGRLDPSRKTALMQFLVEADLVQRVDGRDPIIGLGGADLSYANLSRAGLSHANVSPASLREADLSRADLSYANLSNALSNKADLSRAYMEGANLSGVILHFADLHGADLSGADLSGAYLSKADLSDAHGINNEELAQQSKYLQGATMPDGQKYEEWLKDREDRQEDGGNE
jgi:hypothetical protein